MDGGTPLEITKVTTYCRSPGFQILTSPTRNLDRLYICLVVVVVCLYAEILQIPPDLPLKMAHGQYTLDPQYFYRFWTPYKMTNRGAD